MVTPGWLLALPTLITTGTGIAFRSVLRHNELDLGAPLTSAGAAPEYVTAASSPPTVLVGRAFTRQAANAQDCAVSLADRQGQTRGSRTGINMPDTAGAPATKSCQKRRDKKETQPLDIIHNPQPSPLVGCAFLHAVGFRADIPVFKPPPVFQPDRTLTLSFDPNHNIRTLRRSS